MRADFHHAAPRAWRLMQAVSTAERACHLDDLGVIRVGGDERVSFLQGQLTQDLRRLAADHALRYGWTTAQGRLLATGVALAWQDAIWLTAAHELIDALVARLQQFVLRARVTVAAGTPRLLGTRNDSNTAVLSLPAATACGVVLPGDTTRRLWLTSADPAVATLAPHGALSVSDWRLADIRAGLASVQAATREHWLPQMVNLDLVDGVSFTKGCYSGQEVINRTRHLGRVKRRMLRLGTTEQPNLAVDGPIHGATGVVGHVVAAAPAGAGLELLAVVELSAADTPLYADAGHGQRLTRLPLPYELPAT
jgi:folate-binding protein YgfZ